MSSLKSFVDDKRTFEEVFEYMDTVVNEHIISLVRKGEDVSGMKSAIAIIAETKSKMLREFSKKVAKPVEDRAY